MAVRCGRCGEEVAGGAKRCLVCDRLVLCERCAGEHLCMPDCATAGCAKGGCVVPLAEVRIRPTP